MVVCGGYLDVVTAFVCVIHVRNTVIGTRHACVCCGCVVLAKPNVQGSYLGVVVGWSQMICVFKEMRQV